MSEQSKLKDRLERSAGMRTAAGFGETWSIGCTVLLGGQVRESLRFEPLIKRYASESVQIQRRPTAGAGR